MAKKYRDGLFRDYFNDKRRLLGLCNLLTGEDATDPDEITINTLDGIFFAEYKNDISCLFRGKFLIILEHQSTLNENMPLRMLLYAAELLRQYVDEQKKKLYVEALIPLPAPQFFVFYNGNKKDFARREMRLSYAFNTPSPLELTVQHYNINAGMNDDFVKRDDCLNNYCTFVNLVKNFLAQKLDLNHAIAKAFEHCIANGIMPEYLLTKKKELASMLALEYDPELARQAWIEYGEARGEARGKAIGIDLGIKQGIDRGVEQVAKNLLSMKFSIGEIIAATGLKEEQIHKLAKDDD